MLNTVDPVYRPAHIQCRSRVHESIVESVGRDSNPRLFSTVGLWALWIVHGVPFGNTSPPIVPANFRTSISHRVRPSTGSMGGTATRPSRIHNSLKDTLRSLFRRMKPWQARVRRIWWNVGRIGGGPVHPRLGWERNIAAMIFVK